MKLTTTVAISLLSLGTFAVAKQFPTTQNRQNYIPHKRSALAEAEAYAYAYPEAFYEDVNLFERDAYPEPYYEDHDILERDAYPEALYEEDVLLERDAEADAEPEEWVEKEFYIIPRDAKAEAHAEAMALPWTPKIDVHGGKITKDTLKCNKKDVCSGTVQIQNN
ncbi:hypothetical protein MMC34_004441 [Xylographa carneopallida]|nr:hypothetical protein [Xylographa carneopallida]